MFVDSFMIDRDVLADHINKSNVSLTTLYKIAEYMDHKYGEDEIDINGASREETCLELGILFAQYPQGVAQVNKKFGTKF